VVYDEGPQLLFGRGMFCIDGFQLSGQSIKVNFELDAKKANQELAKHDDT